MYNHRKKILLKNKNAAFLFLYLAFIRTNSQQ